MSKRRLLIGGFVIVNLIAVGVVSNVLAATVIVTMTSGNTFFPRGVIINVGDTVTWQNPVGGVTHNVTADDNSFTSPDVLGGQSFSLVFVNPDTIPYHCAYHALPAGNGMRGTLFVGNRTQHTANEHVLELNAWDFNPSSSGDVTAQANNYYRAPTNLMLAGVHLPTGTEVTGLELVACSTVPAEDMVAWFMSCAEPNSPCVVKAQASTSGTPRACDFYSAAPFVVVVDNLSSTYVLNVQPTQATGSASFRTVRLFYRSSISYPPANPTFTDVPTTHAFYRYIEALVASGATAGCGGGNYCPDAAVTRGQMAVFLARSLGLFWPN